jgi:Undecaprenyl-phosphate glucose phosphotransferase
MSEDCYGLALPEVGSEFLWAGQTTSALSTRAYNFSAFIGAVFLADFALILGVAAVLAGAGGLVAGGDAPAAMLFMFLVLVLFFNNNLFKIEVVEDFGKACPRIVVAWIFSGLIAGGAFVLAAKTKTPIDLHACMITYAAGLGLMMAERLGLTWLFRILVRRGAISHNVAVIGDPHLAGKFSRQLASNRFGARIAMIFDDQAAGSNAVDMLVAYEKTNRIDTIVIALTMAHNERLRALLQRLSQLPANIRILPGEIAMEMKAKRFAPFGEIPGVQLMTIADRPIDYWGVVAKFLLDRSVAFIALVFFGPLMLLCAAAIKLSSPGPILFRQKRIGYKNEIFEVYKFRSMHVNACNTGKLTERNDPRIFKFGHIMRKLSLDELPQIFNVLKGDMSLVGPRPHMPDARAAGKFYFEAVSVYASRHRVKPGITGWAQVCGWRGPTETIEQIENRVAHDLFYIDNWSFSFDILILIKTVFVGFVGKNAF